MFRELLSRESRFPPLLGTGVAALLMGSVAFASAQASLPKRTERVAPPTVPAAVVIKAAAQPHAAAARFVFSQPLPGYGVNSPFGLRKMPWEEGGRLHEGVDIAAPSGAPVRATMAGVVVRSGVDGGYGRFIEVAHEGGLTSFYAHLGRVAALKTGARIAAGDVVGYVGSSGRSTGSHLHFEIRDEGRPLNPVAFLGQAFMTQADLPLSVAAQVPRRVRIAQVSNWPQSVLRKRATVTVASVGDGRVRTVIAPTASTTPVPYRLAQYQRLQAMTPKAKAELGNATGAAAPAMPVIERPAPAAAPSSAPAKAPAADHDVVVTAG